jgi:SAM-dependent methyltransferase
MKVKCARAKTKLLKSWREKQALGEKEYKKTVSDYTRQVWLAEASYADRFGKGFTLNLGAGNSPIKADVNVDPLIKRDVICVGEYLPFKRGSFDTVLIFSVLDHVMDDVKVLREAKRVIRKHGRILVMQSVFGYKDWIFHIRQAIRGKFDPFHLRHYWTDVFLKKVFKKAGLQCIPYEIQYPGGSRAAFATLTKINKHKIF